MTKLYLWVFQRLVSAYPADFRNRYGSEMTQAFEDSISDASSRGKWAATSYFVAAVVDVTRGVCQERIAGAGRQAIATLVAGLLGWALLLWVEFHGSEVQASVLVLLSLGFLFGAAFPKRILLVGLAFGIAIPLGHFVAFLLGREAALFGSALAILPAIIGAACGAAARTLASLPSKDADAYAPLAMACLVAGGLIGLADFTLITPLFASTGIVLCGSVLGFFCKKPWIAAACLGLAVPVSIVVMMALHATPTRHHYIFVDARSIPLCLLAAATGGLAKRIAAPATVQ